MKERYDIDDDRMFLSGHSMDGPGPWHVGLTNVKSFAALRPSAGRLDHETDITVVWGRDKLHTFPRLKAVNETSLQKNLAMPKTYNAAGGTLPMFVLQGGRDVAVPTIQPRSYVRTLANRGLATDGHVGDRRAIADPEQVDVASREVSDSGHRWDKGIGPGNRRSQRLVGRARAPAVVVPDAAVNPQMVREYNLVLFGRPSANAVSEHLADASPTQVGDGQVRVHDETYRGDLGIEFVYPNLYSECLVQVERGRRSRAPVSRAPATGSRPRSERSITTSSTAPCGTRVERLTGRGPLDKHWQVDSELGVFRTVEKRR